MLKNIRKIIPVAILTAAFGIISSLMSLSSLEASETGTRAQIEQRHKVFAEAATVKDAQKLIEFLHTHISDKASFTMKVVNADKKTGSSEMTIGKADYINSYLYGPRQVNNYRMDIKAGTVKTLSAHMLEVEEIYTESGLIMDSADITKPGKDFISRTTCITTYSKANDKTLKMDGGTCKTEISYLHDA